MANGLVNMGVGCVVTGWDLTFVRSCVVGVRLNLMCIQMQDSFQQLRKTHPDVVIMDLDLYARIDGIETSSKIRSQFGVSVVYVWVIVANDISYQLYE